ncbi:hypothetical protein [Mesorhizobium sp. M0772]|uniref:ATP-grasp domain-containing protein n=1 Tax=Mesorhizobium sp. M0772 TaxID=2956998 RepID=UPI00333D53B2
MAAHKPYQLTLAQRLGLQIPETLMTNDSEKARVFWSRHRGEIVHKQFIAMGSTWRETRRLTKEDEAHAASVDCTPTIFQRYVPAVADLRVTMVGDACFAASTDVREAAYPQDVRMNLEAKYEPFELPLEIGERLQKLMHNLGLVYGAIDMRLTPDGQFVFLEINPAGQFLFIEKATGQKISAAIADSLLQENVQK